MLTDSNLFDSTTRKIEKSQKEMIHDKIVLGKKKI